MIMLSEHGALEPLRSNPRVVLIKRIVWVFVLCMFLWAFGGVVNQFRNLLYSNKYAITLLIVGDKRLGVMHYDPKSQRVFKLLLPDKLELQVGSDQKVEAFKFWSYAKGKGDPFVTTKESLMGFFGMNIDGYVEDRNWKDGDFEIGISWVRSPKTRSSLKLWDRYSIVRAIGKLDSGKIKSESLPMSVYQKKVQPDGYETYILDENKFDLYTVDKFAIEALMADRRTVAIINSTGVPGQARNFERILKTSGMGVVEIKEGESERGECRVVYSSELEGVVEWLGQRYGCNLEKDNNTNRQAEIEIYLEKDWPILGN